MINPKVIEDYLKENTDNLNRYKHVTEEYLDKKLAQIAPDHVWNREPAKHQKLCFLLSIIHSRLLLWLDMGTRKTDITINFIKYLNDNGKLNNALVLVPNTINILEWEDEFKLSYGEGRMSCMTVISDSEKLYKIINGEIILEDTVLVTTYRAFLYVVWKQGSGLTKAGTPRKRNTGKKGELDVDYCRQAGDIFQGLFLDESNEIKNWKSLVHQMCVVLSEQVNYLLELTGTPYGKDLQDVWGQYYVADFGDTFGNNITFFRQAFMDQKQDYWSWVYTFRKDRKDDFKRKLFNRAIRFRAESCIDLPKKSTIIKTFDFPLETKVQYEKLIEKIRKMKRREELKSSFLNMRYLAAGYMLAKKVDPENPKIDDRIILPFSENPKLDYLLSIYENLPEDKKLVIFAQYIPTVKIIESFLSKKNIQFLSAHGAERNASQNVRKFKTSDQRIMIATSSFAARGPNFQVANHMIFFECPVSFIQFQQAKRRIYRSGQLHNVFYYIPVIRGTWDRKLLKAHKQGKDLMTEFINNKGLI